MNIPTKNVMFLFKSNVYCSLTNNVENKLDAVVAANKQKNIEIGVLTA